MADNVLTVINNMPAVARALHLATADIVAEVAETIVEQAEAGAPRLSGYLASSGYTVKHDGSSSYDTASYGPALPEIEQPENDQTVYAAMAALYAAFVNYGTSRMGAQPFWEPAIDVAENSFTEALDNLEAYVSLHLGGK